jgi:hypothetical protein
MRPGGVDAGGEHEADLDGGDGLAQQPRFLEQGMDAHKIRVGQGFQPAADDGAVFAVHEHHVGHGADGGQGAVAGEEGILPILAAQGHHQLQRHAHAGQVLEGIGAVGPMGVHHRGGGGQVALALVVVGDDHVQPDGVGVVHLVVAGDAAVHRHHRDAPWSRRARSASRERP